MPRRLEPESWALPTLFSSSGCFETMRAYEGKIFRLGEHLQRLAASAQYLGLTAPTTEELAMRLRRALAKSKIREAVVRIALIPDDARIASPSIVIDEISPPPPALYAKGIRVAIVPTRRFPVSQIDPEAKFSARLGSKMAVMEAQLRGADEAIFTDGAGYVTESTASNLGMMYHGTFIAAPCWQGLLAGVTWQALVQLAADLRIPYREMPVSRHELYNADEAFMTSTIKEVLPVTMIDGRRIGNGRPGPQTTRLLKAFRRLVRKELKLS